MSRPNISETLIRNLSSTSSFERGQDYYHRDFVREMVKRENIITAEVEGNGYDPYLVRITFQADDTFDATCTCPFDWGGYCKHIIAVCLKYIYEAETIVERPSVDSLLADLDTDNLRNLLGDLLIHNPNLISWVEQQLAVQAALPATTSNDQKQKKLATVDAKVFRRRALDIMGSLRGMRPSEAYWYSGNITSQFQDLLTEADPFIQTGDGENALSILEAVTSVYMDHWLDFDDSDGYYGELFSDIGASFAEALLCANLTKKARENWADTLTEWQNDIADYGIEDSFDTAIAAAVQGWDDPALVSVLQGNITNKGAWDRDVPWYGDELALIRLRILERQGKIEQYLYLAEAEGQTGLYLRMLVKLKRTSEAMKYAKTYLVDAAAAFTFAQALREHNHIIEALAIAEKGLGLGGETYHLITWLREFATEAGRPDLALKAARAAFSRQMSLENYQAVQMAAGDNWSTVKSELLAALAANQVAYDKVDIYLHEGMLDEAIATVDQQAYLGFDTLRRVVEAAKESHPQWVIRQSVKQAESIMDAGKSNAYHHAIDWLEKARAAYVAADQTGEWQAYLETLISKHTRKYSLRPRLEGLRLR